MLTVRFQGLSGCRPDELWEKTWQLYLSEQNPSEVLNLIRSLASTTNPHLITRSAIRPYSLF